LVSRFMFYLFIRYDGRTLFVIGFTGNLEGFCFMV
jgi:hypothetical protein